VSDGIAAPFPWFGGKRNAAPLVWQALDGVSSYVEPFCGSLAVLLGRPGPGRVETVNDADDLLVNAWRAIRWAPDEVARWTDWPVSEADLGARHWWLLQRRDEITHGVSTDPDWFDAKAAGWWIWGHCAWIGSGFCSGRGPWTIEEGEWVKRPRKLPHLGDAGQGIHRQLPHLGNAGRGIHRQLPHLGNAGRGIHRQLPHLGNAVWGERIDALREWMQALAARLERVRITCGDWSRVVTPAAANPMRDGRVGVFLDPPYPVGEVDYAQGDRAVWDGVVAWVTNAPPEWRIVLAGYAGTFDPPDGWTEIAWKSRGGYGATKRGRTEERLWCSPSCASALEAA
jgi:hypothetical protein